MDVPARDTLAALTALVRTRGGDAGAEVHTLAALPGHAGFSYSFVVDGSDGSSRKMVVRLAPPGVKIAGPADVARQAKIMMSLADTAVPVPPVYWYGDEPELFGRPYMVVGFVGGFKLVESALPQDDLRRLGRAGVEMLAALHSLLWEPRCAAFGNPFPLSEEMQRLDHLLDRPTLDPGLVAAAPALRQRLYATLPEAARIGCVHGDFQWANILFDAMRPVALIDWEIALIGPTLLDVGWISFFADPGSFHDTSLQPPAILSPDEIAETYAAAAPYPVATEHIRWFRAFAGYRFGVITCFNVMLHRRGKRHDPHWELIAPSAPLMFEHGLQLLS